MVRTFVGLWGLGLVACSHFPRLDVAALPAASAYPKGTPWVVLLDETEVRFFAGPDGKPRALETSRWRAKLLRPAELPAVTAYYDTTFNEIVSVRGRTIDPKGVERALDTEKLSDQPVFSGSVLFSNDRVKRLAAPTLAPGSVLETEVVTLRRDILPWVAVHWFDGSAPVAQSRLIVDAPAGWSLDWRVEHAERLATQAPVREDTKTGQRWTVAAKDLAALTVETGGPPLRRLVARAQVRLAGWDERGVAKAALATPQALSSWLWERYDAQAAVDAELEGAVAEALVGVDPSPRAKAKALYDYACRRIQYCAIEVGYGGWFPHAAKDVHRQRWGDCKDKATYLHSLLKVAGIASSPTLIFSHDGWPEPFGLPALGANFNHAILAVHLPDGDVFADPTERTVPFGDLPPRDREATVLQVKASGAPLGVTPPSPVEQNAQSTRLELTIGVGGDAVGTVRLAAKGSNAAMQRWPLVTGEKTAAAWLEGRVGLQRARVVEAKAIAATDLSDALEVEGRVEAPRLVSAGEDGLAILRLSDFAPTDWLPHLEGDRAVGWATRWREVLSAEYELRLPPGTVVGQLPAPASQEGLLGRYTVSWERRADVLVATRRLWRSAREVTPGQLADARRFVAQARLADATPLVLRLPAQAPKEGGAP